MEGREDDAGSDTSSIDTEDDVIEITDEQRRRFGGDDFTERLVTEVDRVSVHDSSDDQSEMSTGSQSELQAADQARAMSIPLRSLAHLLPTTHSPAFPHLPTLRASPTLHLPSSQHTDDPHRSNSPLTNLLLNPSHIATSSQPTSNLPTSDLPTLHPHTSNLPTSQPSTSNLPTSHPPTTSLPTSDPPTPHPSLPVPDQSSPNDFHSPKRRRMMTSVKPSRRNDSDSDEDEGCPICFEPWTNSGGHRLASLKCGHLFGQSCIEKWLRGQGGKCPQCNVKAQRKDIRVIYAKAIKTVDTTERDRALAELETERAARRRAEMEAAQARLRFQMVQDECRKMKEDLESHKQQLEALRSANLPSSQAVKQTPVNKPAFSGGYQFEKTIKICDGGQCRVMTYCPHSATLCVSQPSISHLFPGFGVRKMNVMDWRTSQYVNLHTKMVRDVSFNPGFNDNLLLSCSMDKTVSVTNMISNVTVQTFRVDQPLWSCVWNPDQGNVFYVGLQTGAVNMYDLRNTSEHVLQLNQEGSRSPAVSLQYVPHDLHAEFRPGGLLVGQLDRCTFYEKTHRGDYRLHVLPSQGSLTSLSLEPHTRHLVTTYRPSTRQPSVTHLMQGLSQVASEQSGADGVRTCTAQTLHTFIGGKTQKMLSRNRILCRPDDKKQLLYAAGDEASMMVYVWDTVTGQLAQKLPSQGSPVLDLCPVEVNDQQYLVSLMDKQIALYKWR